MKFKITPLLLIVALCAIGIYYHLQNRQYAITVFDAFDTVSTINVYSPRDNTKEYEKLIKEYDKSFFVRDYSDNDFFDYIRGETMAYIFKIEEDNRVSDKILRLDLCRNIHSGNIFQGGIFHILKHFTLEGYNTLSSFGKEFSVESWREIYHIIIQNFFSNDFLLEKGNYYEAKSSLKDGHILRGIYYKNDVAQVYFLDSLRID